MGSMGHLAVVFSSIKSEGFLENVVRCVYNKYGPVDLECVMHSHKN